MVGSTGLLLEDAARRRRVEARVAARWQAWGYNEVTPPAWLAWEDVGLGASGLPAQACKFLDPQGRVLTLRPDNTLAIARLAAGDLAGEARPLRLYYAGEVFRRGREAEGPMAVPQWGVELIGSASPLADAEVLALAAESLLALGLQSFRISAGHVGLLRRVLSGAGLTEAARGDVMAALQNRDYVALEQALAAVEGVFPGDLPELLRWLTSPLTPQGGEGLARWLAKCPEGLTDWANLQEVLSLIALYGFEEYITIELGLVRDLEYYTGLVFEVNAPGLARPLGGGGRYDSLLGRFGSEEPATGFAFEVRELMAALEAGGRLPEDGTRAGCMLLARDGRQREAWARAREMREAGAVVEVDVAERPLEDALAYARRRGARAVLVLDAAGEREIALAGEGS